MNFRQTYRLLGLMSGSSLDGIDLAVCQFELDVEDHQQPVRNWKVEAIETISFPLEWQKRLRDLPQQDAATFCRTDIAFGHFLGKTILAFLEKHQLGVDAIASHGHTVFHLPEDATTAQIGSGAAIAAETGLLTIDNFRALDMALGGQGAPLAPKADQLLFPDFDSWLNLGGIANISCRQKDRIIAFDISGANQIFNDLVAPLELPYDDKGKIAAAGKLLPELLKVVDALPYFQLPFPKSLGNDWVQHKLLPIFKNWNAEPADKLHTAVLHLAHQIAQSMTVVLEQEKMQKSTYRMLVTGGGAFNTFLISCIERECQKNHSLDVIIPDSDIIQFKEAILMALLGALRLAEIPNCLSSVTGARLDAVGGSLHWGWKE